MQNRPVNWGLNLNGSRGCLSFTSSRWVWQSGGLFFWKGETQKSWSFGSCKFLHPIVTFYISLVQPNSNLSTLLSHELVNGEEPIDRWYRTARNVTSKWDMSPDDRNATLYYTTKRGKHQAQKAVIANSVKTVATIQYHVYLYYS